MRANKVQDISKAEQYPINSMNKGKTSFRPLAHKGTGKAFSDLDYLLLLGEYIQYGADEWKRNHPNREFKAKDINPAVQTFAQIIYKAHEDGVSNKELAEYIADSIDLDH